MNGITINETGAACGSTKFTGTNGVTTTPGCKTTHSEATYVAIAASTMALAVSATFMWSIKFKSYDLQKSTCI